MTLSFLQSLREQGYSPRSFLDVGAHVGTFTKQFLDIFPSCVPTLVEPNPFCAPELSRSGHEVHFAAASNAPGVAELFLTKEWLQSTGSSLYRENTAFFRDDVVVRREVNKFRIDDLFAGRQFDFVKIDTQGSELDVLQGGETVLGKASYILVEVSLVNYNINGASAEAVFAQLSKMGFQCSEVTEFHRLGGINDGGLLQIDVLFKRRQAQVGQDDVRKLALKLCGEGRLDDALVLFQHLDRTGSGDAEVLKQMVRILGSSGRTLEAIAKLAELKALRADMDALIAEILPQMPSAIAEFNRLVGTGDVVAAERLASALAELIPGNAELQKAAMSCNAALGQTARAAEFEASLKRLTPVAVAPTLDVHPLIRLRDINDAAGLILCGELDDEKRSQVAHLITKARALDVTVPPGSDWEGWLKHYRLAMDAIDAPDLSMSLPGKPVAGPSQFVSASGKAMSLADVQAQSRKLGARAVFFAAADQAYIDLYARWYIKSILKYSDVNCLVIVHVIGGAGNLKPVAKSLGISDARLVLAGDSFSEADVRTKCHDTPPKGLIAKPVAHLQSVRFLQLGALLTSLKLPVFVSDIDLVLQRGVADLLDRCDGADLVFNENAVSTNAGSRLTANLLLAYPTANTLLFQKYLGDYLEHALGGAEVSRWIDQFGLLMARHHLQAHGTKPRIDYFDTNSDINNVMYKTFQANPFRFLSLYHGFDTSSLESDGMVQPAKPGRRKVA